MGKKDQEGLESTIELLRTRTTKGGAEALKKSLQISSPEQQVAHWAGFVGTLVSGIPGISALANEILAQASWDGMRRAIAELEDERVDDAKRAELLTLFDASNAEQHGETVRAVGTMLSNHREELEAKMFEIFQAQLSKLFWDDKTYRDGLDAHSEKKLGRLFFKMEAAYPEMFEQMDRLDEEFKVRTSRDSRVAGRDIIEGDHTTRDMRKAGRNYFEGGTHHHHHGDGGSGKKC